MKIYIFIIFFLTPGRCPLPVHGAAHEAQAGRGGAALVLVPPPQADRGRDRGQQGDALPPGGEGTFRGENILTLFQAHGDCDPVVPYKWGQLTSQKLREILPRHEFKSYKVRNQAQEAEV